MATICLTMIVKNEGEVITRCLDSLVGLIDHWVICDTGSTDDTREIIKAKLRDVPGELHERPWVNFAHNRNESLRIAREKADYCLLVDADEVVNVHEDPRGSLTADSYLVQYDGNVDYRVALLVSNRHSWQYKGATHEVIHAPTAKTRERLPALTITHHADGGSRGDKFERDLALLTAAVIDEPDNARHKFYLAQTHRAMGHHEEALEWYIKRIEAGGWAEEVWYSMYQGAQMQERLGMDWTTVLQLYLAAFDYRPARAEPLYHIAQHYRGTEEYDLGYAYAKLAMDLPYPEQDILFITRRIYDYGIATEYAICCEHLEKDSEAISASNRVLDCRSLPRGARQSVLRSRKSSLERLYGHGWSTRGPRRKNNRLKAIMGFHNAGKYVERCRDSLLSQTYDDFELLFADDGSTDGAYEKLLGVDDRISVMRNEDRIGKLYAQDKLIKERCDPDDIVLLIDGDDWLTGDDVFAYINDFYRQYQCWVMYGQYTCSDGKPGMAKPYSDPESFARMRGAGYLGHLRSFRAGVYHKVAEQDPDYSCLRHSTGEFIRAATDMAIMYPILELAGFDRVRYNDRPIYVYNLENPLNTHKIDHEYQKQCAREIVAKPTFEPILDYR